jgi:hypothetical protein
MGLREESIPRLYKRISIAGLYLTGEPVKNDICDPSKIEWESGMIQEDHRETERFMSWFLFDDELSEL